MKNKEQHLRVFEYESLRLGEGENDLCEDQLLALQQFYGGSGVPYYSLIHQGVRFCEYVGVLQVGETIIEVLPKADKQDSSIDWQSVLIDMLRAVGAFPISAPSSSTLNIKPNSILDLYFELFLKEVKFLLHKGLVKKYRKVQGNCSSLKGNLLFDQHLNQNLIHKERFYISYTTYDKIHDLNCILYKTLILLTRINTNQKLIGHIQSLLLDFPEMPDIKVSESTFQKLSLDRKTQEYKHALEIARLLLLNYHPDVSKGSNHVLTLMFNMNFLWEQFVYSSLRKYRNSQNTVTAQNPQEFWKSAKGNTTFMKPDIVLNKDEENCIVLDTKWKNLDGYKPSTHDLRQMFAYSKYFGAQKVALVYPGKHSIQGHFHPISHEKIQVNSNRECKLFALDVIQDCQEWQKSISRELYDWASSP